VRLVVGRSAGDLEVAKVLKYHCLKNSPNMRELVEVIERQFQLENLGALERCPPAASSLKGPKSPAFWTPLEQKAEGLMTVQHEQVESGGSFTVRIPWRECHYEHLQGNYQVVLRRQVASHSEKALKKKGVELREVNEIIATYLLKGYIEEVPKGEETSGWYLPFFEVVNRSKSTPIRLVFDAKAKYRGVSLNQQIMDTPNRLNDLTKVLTRFRRFRYVFAGDITEMFLQIRLHPGRQDVPSLYS